MATVIRAGYHASVNHRYVPSRSKSDHYEGLFDANVCIEEEYVDPSYGYLYNSHGTITPQYTKTGQLVYGFEWFADGEIRVRFGDLGNEPIPDTEFLRIISPSGQYVTLLWDIVNLYYTGNDIAVTNELISGYEPFRKICTRVEFLPNKFISYNFALLRGTKI